MENQSTKTPSESAPSLGYAHPTTISEFEEVYRKEHAQQLKSSDNWIKFCEQRGDHYGVNFHQGMRAAHVFNGIKMSQLLRVLKQESPNAKPTGGPTSFRELDEIWSQVPHGHPRCNAHGHPIARCLLPANHEGAHRFE